MRIIVPRPPNLPAARLWGFADTHAHFMTHVAHGAKTVFGKPFDPAGLQAAMPQCTSVHGPGGIFPSAEWPHRTGGFPNYDGWPKFTGYIHHAAHVDWIQRVWQGGLRLVVMFVSNNELLGKIFGSTRPYDDRSVTDASLTEMQRMIAFIDGQSGGAGKGWMQIAKTPAEARALISAGKLAVVLGVEVDALGNWRKAGDLPQGEAARPVLRAYLEELHRRGVRHIFPVHLYDNALGASAAWSRMFDIVTYLKTGKFQDVDNGWSSGVRFRMDQDFLLPDWAKTLLTPVVDLATHGAYSTHNRQISSVRGGHINKLGLSAEGKIAVEEMMRLGILVDIDHMSMRSRRDTFEIAERRGYPLIAGHTGFRDLAFTANTEYTTANGPSTYGTSLSGHVAHEGQLANDDVERIRKLGGMIATGLSQHAVRSWGSKIPNDCDWSSKTFAQAYLYALRLMQGAPVAIGSDVNGWAQAPAPRFGPKACWGSQEDQARRSQRAAQVAAQRNGVRYGSAIADYRSYRFESASNDPVYTQEEREIWEAIAIFKSKRDPRKDSIDGPGLLQRAPWTQGKVNNIAIGFWLQGTDAEFNCGLFGGNCPHERRAAYYVRAGKTPQPGDHHRVKELYPLIKKIWDRWAAAEGDNPPLPRSLAGRRDFDINIDGVAHYGLFPDFIQDLRNVGLTADDLAPLFRSAERYLEVWEKAESKAAARGGAAPAASVPAKR
jgi:microsomal dipeptidase-like Zn-dependent dipeptidase